MSFDYVILWALTALNSFVILLLIRQLATLPQYQAPSGPRVGTRFTDWTLNTLAGEPRSGGEMPSEYTMLFTSESCGPCHVLLASLARVGRPAGRLVIAAGGDAMALERAAVSATGPLYDDFLAGADIKVMRDLGIPSTPYAVAIRHGHVVAAGPARTPDELEKISALLRHAPRAVPVR